MSRKAIIQDSINAKVVDAIDRFNHEFSKPLEVRRLRFCTAEVIVYQDWFALRSYDTIIALIDRRTDICFDFLRHDYGYTSTSAQHIAKFEHDYGAAAFGCCMRLTYRPI